MNVDVEAEPEILIPITPLAEVAIGAVKLPTRLLTIVIVLLVVVPTLAMPTTTEPAAVPLLPLHLL